MCRLQNFLCCCSLRSGAIIITVFTTITVVCSAVLVGITFISDDKDLDDICFNRNIYTNKCEDRYVNEAVKNFKVVLWIMRGCYISIVVLGLPVCICLCCALMKNSGGCVVPYLIWAFISEVLYVTIAITGFINQAWASGVYGAVLALITLYEILVMNSFRLELNEGVTLSRRAV